MVFSGDRTRVRPVRPARALQANLEASSVGGSGPRPNACRGVWAWLIMAIPPGAEASSGAMDTCRSKGRGVEKVRSIPRVGTPGNPVVRLLIQYNYRSVLLTVCPVDPVLFPAVSPLALARSELTVFTHRSISLDRIDLFAVDEHR